MIIYTSLNTNLINIDSRNVDDDKFDAYLIYLDKENKDCVI